MARRVLKVESLGYDRAINFDWPAGPLTTTGTTVDLPLTVVHQANAYVARQRPPFFCAGLPAAAKPQVTGSGHCLQRNLGSGYNRGKLFALGERSRIPF